MFEVKGIPILIDEVEILKELRQQVYLQQNREILRKIKPSGDNIMICCPIHNNGQERNPSCGILTSSKGRRAGTVHCFACGYTDSLEGMISKCFGYDNDSSFGENWLLENFVSMETYQRPDLIVDFSRDNKKSVIQYITEEELCKYRYYHPYMFKRKLTKEVIDKYDVGYQKDYIHEENWYPTEVITFPVKDENGNCLFVSRRAIHNKTFFLPKNMDKPVYGIYELPRNCNEVIICESVINALTCVVYGRPALALFGTGAPNQFQQLMSLPCRSFILATDKDDAGRKARYKLRKALAGKLVTEFDYNSYPAHCNDLNDMTQQEFNNLKIIM